MNTSLDMQKDWNFRLLDKRLVIIKTKSEKIHKTAVLDVITSLSFALEVPDTKITEKLNLGKQYLVNLKVFTSKNTQGVDKEFTGFFEALDIDQSMEDFIKAYWVYPGKIRFQLVEAEEP
jgi:hypothetical protein